MFDADTIRRCASLWASTFPFMSCTITPTRALLSGSRPAAWSTFCWSVVCACTVTQAMRAHNAPIHLIRIPQRYR